MLKTLHHPNGTTRQIHLGGWKKQFTDARDEEFRVKLHGSFLKIAPSADNRPICSPVEDQGDLGSCTANMFAGLVESNEIKRIGPNYTNVKLDDATGGGAKVTVSNVAVAANGVITYTTKVVPPAPPAPTPPAPPAPPQPTPPSPPQPTPPTPPAPPAPPPTPPTPPAPAKLERASRLFEYYATRKIEGTVNEDSGATIRDAIKAGAQYGVADEAAWGYDISKFTTNPPTTVWSSAATHMVTSYHAITDGDLQTMKSVLASGFLIGFGFQVFDYMMSAQMASTGMLPYPGQDEQLQGGHAVCLVGYDDTKQITRSDGTVSTGAFLVRNSWGTGWGLAGYFWVAYDYVGDTNLASDFWVVQSAPI